MMKDVQERRQEEKKRLAVANCGRANFRKSLYFSEEAFAVETSCKTRPVLEKKKKKENEIERRAVGEMTLAQLRVENGS